MPYDEGMLEAGDGHRLYWAACGNPLGKPALVLHGGPGSGCSLGWTRFFNPDRYRIILLDQRGAGRSTPHASEANIDLSTNTTPHLLGDIERLRKSLDISRWLLLGASWGSTLALAYSEQHPGRVSEMVLFSITTTTRREIDWITRGVGAFFPEAWHRFCNGVPENARDGDLARAYHRLLMHRDPQISGKAARDWCDWEIAIVSVHPGDTSHPRYEQEAFRLGFARLVTHYWSQNAWLVDGVLLRNANLLAKIPGVLVHGRLDLSCPLETAWNLGQHWKGSRLIIADQGGHSANDSTMIEGIVASTDGFVG